MDQGGQDGMEKIGERKEQIEKLPAAHIIKRKFETNIRMGKVLASMVKQVHGLQKRDCFERISKYLYSNDYTRVCAVYGLRRTGKTTMIFQAIADMPAHSAGGTDFDNEELTDGDAFCLEMVKINRQLENE